MTERRSFVEEKDLMNAKIVELEAMNEELLAKDFEVGKLESEINELTKSLAASMESEAEIRNRLESSEESKWILIYPVVALTLRLLRPEPHQLLTFVLDLYTIVVRRICFYAVWKSRNFSITQILHETSFVR